MRALVQTVSNASVTVDGAVVGRVTATEDRPGLLVLLGVTHSDTEQIAAALARKTYGLRIIDTTDGERSAADLGAPILVISQFTLYADTRKGRRPSWSAAAPAEEAEPLVEAYVSGLRAVGAHVETGRFRAHMLVSSVNVGPCTVLLES